MGQDGSCRQSWVLVGEKVTLPHCQWLGLWLREGKMLLGFLEQWKVVADLAGEVGNWRAWGVLGLLYV